MVATVPLSPFTQTNGNAGLFNATSVGFRQGTAMADPATRYRLRAGILATTETLPMWGGVGVYAFVPGGDPANLTQPNVALGTVVGRATALTGTYSLVGFSVFDEAYGMVTSPQYTVPLAGSGMQVNYYPLGSLARVVVACDPSLVSLVGTGVQSQVTWDFTNQLLVPFLGTLTIASGTYNNTTGLVTLTMNASVTFSAGDSITVANLGAGSGAYASLNGTYTVLSASGTTVTYNPGAGLGSASIGSGNVTVGGIASQDLNVEVLAVRASNCETVTYSASAGTVTWNYNGSAALIALNNVG